MKNNIGREVARYNMGIGYVICDDMTIVVAEDTLYLYVQSSFHLNKGKIDRVSKKNGGVIFRDEMPLR